MSISPIWSKVLDQVSKIEIRSVTDPLFKYGLYLMALGVICAVAKTETWVIIVLFSAGGILEVAGLISYKYFSKKNPDYLRSESFQLKKQSIEVLGDKDNRANPNVKDVPLITSPYARRLENEENSLD